MRLLNDFEWVVVRNAISEINWDDAQVVNIVAKTRFSDNVNLFSSNESFCQPFLGEGQPNNILRQHCNPSIIFCSILKKQHRNYGVFLGKRQQISPAEKFGC